MAPMKALYISGSLGLGHVMRDLAIGRELQRRFPGLELSWLAAKPASQVIEQAGQTLLPEAGQFADESTLAENAASGTRLNLLNYLMNARPGWAHNVELFKQLVTRESYDLVIADESYEILLARRDDPALVQLPFVMLYDFVGLDAMTNSPMEQLGIYMWNRIWSKGYKDVLDPNLLELFIGEEQDIPDKKFGFLLPNRRTYAREKYRFIGYVLGFNVEDYASKDKIRAELGYGDEPLIICSIGGTSVGKDLLELCGKAYSFAREKLPDLKMVLVCGPRISPEQLDVPSGAEVMGYLPELFKHFAACDLAVVQGGGHTTLELTALRRQFIYFPLEQHFEQQIAVAGRLERQKAGIKMLYSQTTPESLAEVIVANLGKEVTYEPIPANGAQKAGELIEQFCFSRIQRPLP